MEPYNHTIPNRPTDFQLKKSGSHIDNRNSRNSRNSRRLPEETQHGSGPEVMHFEELQGGCKGDKDMVVVISGHTRVSQAHPLKKLAALEARITMIVIA